MLAGAELCISYIESELLSESAAVRNEAMGDRDFRVTDAPAAPCATAEARGTPAGGGSASSDGSDGVAAGDEEYDGPALSPDMLDAVRATHPLEQLSTVSEVLGDAESVERFRPSDHKELSLIQGLALAQLGSPAEALVHWEDCLRYNARHCPPNDEATVCYAFQAALCALAVNKADAAVAHVLTAARAHAVAFGPGLPLCAARYATEMATAPPPLQSAAAKVKAMLAVDDTAVATLDELAPAFLELAL